MEVGYYDTPDWAYGVAVSGSYTYVASSRAGLQIYRNLLGVEEGANRQLVMSNRQLSVYPNPFTHNTVIQFVVRSWEFVDEKPLTLKIHDLSGRLVRSFDLTNHQSPFSSEGGSASGGNQIAWDGRDDSGKQVAAGIYFCGVEVGEFKVTKKLTILR
jgi:hypothetical protein